MKKTNWKNKLRTVLGKSEFSEVSTNSQLTKADKSHLSLVSSVIVSGNPVDTSENFTNSPELGKKTQLVSSAFVSGQLAETPRNFDELREIKSGRLHELLNNFIEAGVTFKVSTDDFQVVDTDQNLKTSDREFLELNHSIILCQLQQSGLTKHLF
jgi:Na+-transporting NADH:ubiquinone oxidoreductase subunit NqrC